MQAFMSGEEEYTFMMQLSSALADEALSKVDINKKHDELCLRTVSVFWLIHKGHQMTR